MDLGFPSLLSTFNEIEEVIKGLQQGLRQQVYGTTGPQSAYFMASLCETMSHPALVVTFGTQQAQKVYEDLKTFLPGRRVFLFPELEMVSYGVLAQSKEVLAARLEVLAQLTGGAERAPGTIVVAPGAALLRKLVPAKVFQASCRELVKGQTVAIGELIALLVELGYERVDMVEGRGQFSVRGDIFDIFPLTLEEPARVEFFGDEIEGIRLFDVATQRSRQVLDRLFITPAHEFVLGRERLAAGREKLSLAYQSQQKKLIETGRKKARQKLAERSAEIMTRLGEQGYFQGLQEFFPCFYEKGVSLLEYFTETPFLLIDELGRVHEHIEHIATEKAHGLTQLLEQGTALPEQAGTYFTQQEFWHLMGHPQTVAFSLLPRQIPLWKPLHTTAVTAKTLPAFQGRMALFLEEINNWRKKDYRVLVIAANEDRVQRLRQVFSDGGIPFVYPLLPGDRMEPGRVYIFKGMLSGGFEFPLGKVAVVTDGEVFGFKKVSRRAKATEGASIISFADLAIGDYVVHEQHGIGRYIGIEQLEVAGIHKDYFLIQYAGEDRLYIPTDQVGLLQKYLGAGEGKPKVNKLGGNEWNRVKNKVRASVQEMAEDLLELYAARDAAGGHAFGPDTPWQREFEDVFPYEETPDQLKSIEEIKKDLEKTRPMDRLLCGDVGYGKTEVAIRAAFKVVMEGKQVVVLVPTTVLAQQHYHTFRNRFKGYPVNIEMLSRFRTPKEQKEIIAKLRRGAIDIIIGTHRLVQGDVELKDLGLLVIDEEHRFGVVHKEKLKRVRLNVDVLTLTATPIPRTLHMSLIGVRDMSVLDNPPEDRFPVQTYVTDFNMDIIKEAIRREVDRGGQVFYVYNRVQDIEKIAAQIQKALPDVRCAVAHGQMKEAELEEVMVDFVNGEYQALLCTTIIESGLDMPNVNTIIVQDADKLGLSQLYQLRGRVGRSFRQAYAYFTYRRDKALSEIAEKRLHAIREFTEFGSGFKIALRDLEIRGTGNILGAEQHGHMAAVGFAMYCRLLEETIQNLKGTPQKEEWEPHIDLRVDAYLPAEFIKDNAQKIETYYDIMRVKTHRDLAEVRSEIEDRYGDLPRPVQNLMEISTFKILSYELKIKSITQEGTACSIEFLSGDALNGHVLALLAETYGRKLSFSTVDGLTIKVQNIGIGDEILQQLSKVLNKIQSLSLQNS